MAYIGKSPTAAPLTSSDVADGIITNAKLAQDIISADTALGAAPADTDEFLVSDAGVLKRMDYSYIKGGGKIGQVVQTVNTGTETLSSTTATTISDFTVSITPAATSSKILVMVDMNTGGSGSYNTNLQLFRDTTQIYLADAASSRSRTFAWSHVTNARFNRRANGIYLDSPSSTSELDYSVKWYSEGANAIYLNRTANDVDNAYYDGRGASSITVMEVLA